MGKTYAILGGGGSFGINTALYLLDQPEGCNVIGIGRNPLRPGAFSLGVEHHPRFTYKALHLVYERDLLLDYLDEVRPHYIINFAAQGEGAASWTNSWRFFDTNATALVWLVEQLGKRDWLERFVQIGTSELYGSVDHPAKETDPIQPSSPYAASKAAFDLHLMAVHKHLGFPMNILRPSNAYCPGQLLHRIIPKCMVAGLTGRKVPLHGGGYAAKSYIHARDLARAIYMTCQAAPIGKVYNVGPVEPTEIREVVVRCSRMLGLAFNDLCQITGERLGQDARYWLDSSAIKHDLGWEPQIGWDDGLTDMLRWARKHIDVLRYWPTDYQLRA